MLDLATAKISHYGMKTFFRHFTLTNAEIPLVRTGLQGGKVRKKTEYWEDRGKDKR